MRILLALSCAASLAACGGAVANTAEAEETVAAAPEAAAVDPAADVGLFDVTDSEGGEFQMRRNADGTFTDIVGGEDVGGGTWRRNDAGQMCFAAAVEDAEESCWTDSAIAEDGSWTSTGSDGRTVTVRRAQEPDAVAG